MVSETGHGDAYLTYTYMASLENNIDDCSENAMLFSSRDCAAVVDSQAQEWLCGLPRRHDCAKYQHLTVTSFEI
jgi:hypothetical protein